LCLHNVIPFSYMSKQKSHTDKTAGADKTSIGFDYQHYFFLWKLFSLDTGESVGLEVKDDVHTELKNDKQVLYQLKHTIKKGSEGKPINLTELDKDMWKTFSNWAKIISDKNDGRSTKSAQLRFLAKTDFVLASNKSSNDNNEILSAISDFQNEKKTLSSLKKVFSDRKEATNNDTIERYIGDVLDLEDSVLEKFVSSTFFELDEDDLHKKCKDEIKADKIPENRIDDVFSSIDSAIRKDNFFTIKNRGKIIITFEEYYKKYRKYYDIARTGKLPIRRFKSDFPDSLENQTFIRQLIEIKDIDSEDIETITRHTRSKIAFISNIDEWVRNGEITNDEVELFLENAKMSWLNEYRRIHRNKWKILGFENKHGRKIIDLLRQENLKIDNQEIGISLSNGTFYRLSDIPEIGWRSDWKKYQ